MDVRLRIKGPSGQMHVLQVQVHPNSNQFSVNAKYVSGDLKPPQVALIADWLSTFECPIPGIDRGHLDIGQGRLDIQINELRGIGLGSFLMSFIVCWAHRLPNVPLSTILLSADDAISSAALSRRNRFWEKLGVEFDYQDGGRWGQSKGMMSHDLVDPGFKLANGWDLEEI